MTELQQYIQAYFGIEHQYLEILEELFAPTNLVKHDYFVKSGKYCQKLSFIKSGHLRIFDYVDGKDITQWISTKGEFVTDISSLIFNQAAKKNIQAITDCELYTIRKEDYDKLGSLVPKWDILEKLFLAKCFMTLEDRIFGFLSLTAEERYFQMQNIKPDIFHEVPLIYIASMMGMSPETLSRIRAKKI